MIKAKGFDYKNNAKEIKKLIQKEDKKWMTNNHKYNKIACMLSVYAGNSSLSDYYTNHELKHWFSPVVDCDFRGFARLKSIKKIIF